MNPAPSVYSRISNIKRYGYIEIIFYKQKEGAG